MADSARTTIFVFLIVFWTLLTIFSRTFNITTGNTDVSNLKYSDSTLDQSTDSGISVKGFFDSIFTVADNIPVVNLFVPIAKILSFQYTDQIPYWLSLFLSITGILTVFIIYTLIRGG